MAAGASLIALRRLWLRVVLAPLLVLSIVVVDRMVDVIQPSLAVHGVLDEVGHLATTGVLLSVGLRLVPAHRRPRPVVVAMALVGSVLIDVDHVPAVLGWEGLTEGTPRPYPHSVTTLALLALAAVVAPRQARPYALAALAGVAAHLFRDLGTAPVALFWPLSSSGQEIPYAYYLGLTAVAAVADAVAAASRLVDGGEDGQARRQRRFARPSG